MQSLPRSLLARTPVRLLSPLQQCLGCCSLDLYTPVQTTALRFAATRAIKEPNQKRASQQQPRLPSFPPLNHFIPLTQNKPSIFSKDYYKYLAKQAIKYGIFYHQTRELAKIYTNHRQNFKKGSTDPVTQKEINASLPEEALIIYTRMNDAFARGDLEELRNLCTQEMLESLVKELNQRKNHLSYSFVVDEIVQQPKLVSALSADISHDKNQRHYSQIVVRMQLKQTVKVADEAGNTLGEKKKTTDEYVLFSRQFPPIGSTPPGWLVYGKLKETGLNNPSK